MNTSVKRLLMTLCAGVVLLASGVGCNTTNGFGKDVEKAGEGIQNATK